jgi:hypothetical protein
VTGPGPRHQLRQFTRQRFEAVRDRWRELAGGDDEFDSELAPMFEWCTSHLSPRAGDSQAFELYHVERDETDAILEVIDSRRGAKLLKLFPSPEFWVIDSDEARTRVTELYGGAFAQVIANGIAKGTPLVKIYGRSDPMVTLLQGLQTRWPAEELGSDAAMEGRWLAISIRS